VACERGFSIQNLIKTAIRASMDAHTDEPVFLNILMRIRANRDLIKRSMYPRVVRKWLSLENIQRHWGDFSKFRKGRE